MNVLRGVATVNHRDQWDNYRNCDIRENLGVTSVEAPARVSRLRWFDDRLPKRILSAEVPGVRGRRRRRRWFIDSVRSDLEVWGLRLDELVISLAHDRVVWREMVHH